MTITSNWTIMKPNKPETRPSVGDVIVVMSQWLDRDVRFADLNCGIVREIYFEPFYESDVVVLADGLDFTTVIIFNPSETASTAWLKLTVGEDTVEAIMVATKENT